MSTGARRWPVGLVRGRTRQAPWTSAAVSLRESRHASVLATLLDNAPPWSWPTWRPRRRASCTCRCRRSSRPSRSRTRCDPQAWTRCWHPPRPRPAWPQAPAQPLPTSRRALWRWPGCPPPPVAMPAGHRQDHLHLGHAPARRRACACGVQAMRRVPDGLVAGDGAAGHPPAPVRAAVLGAAGEHCRPDGAAGARRHGASRCRWRASGWPDRAGFDAGALRRRRACATQPHSVILLPQMLRAWAAYLQHSGQRAPAALKFVAVGGAAVGASR